MARKYFPLEKALESRRALLVKVEARTACVHAELAEAEGELRELNERRGTVRHRLACSVRNPSGGAAVRAARTQRGKTSRLRAHLRALWLQMIAVNLLIQRRRLSRESLEVRLQSTRYHVRALERLREQTLGVR